MNSGHSTQKQVVGVRDIGWLALRALDLRLFQSRRDHAHDARGHFILKIKDVIQRTLETVSPETPPVRCVDEFSRDARLVRRLAYAASEHVAYPQFAPNLPHVHGTPLVSEARIACDDE